jgi:hypothetical protein
MQRNMYRATQEEEEEKKTEVTKEVRIAQPKSPKQALVLHRKPQNKSQVLPRLWSNARYASITILHLKQFRCPVRMSGARHILSATSRKRQSTKVSGHQDAVNQISQSRASSIFLARQVVKSSRRSQSNGLRKIGRIAFGLRAQLLSLLIQLTDGLQCVWLVPLSLV